ncbi:hypothetical protein, variant [Verruconis gallopava]|uniref:DEAD/DEAH box helicase n=1 Tax=Verruconis gallopava TaxID=253628 RepID=A0A0D2AH27_9PEZI|nr:hypothetical protein, variant [Verruconis gallopava]KIW05870.1 hypothetical protein, variant [Verruconis gallopava]
MVKLQAATVSNQVVHTRKRKRQHAEGCEHNPVSIDSVKEPERVSEEFPSNLSKPASSKTAQDGKRSRKPKNATDATSPPELARHDSSTLVETSIPWPDHFARLSQLHRALNIVYTFCSSRKSFATTLDNIRSSVEGHIKRTLEVEEVAQVVALVPRSINFSYVDEAMLMINLMGADETFKGGTGNQFILPEQLREGAESERREVLLFEFVDGDLKRQVQHAKTGEPTKATQKLRNERLKMPVFSQKQMLNLIEKRNLKFTSAVNAFLNQADEEKIDPVLKLLQESQQYIPKVTNKAINTAELDRSAPLPACIPAERASISQIISEIKSLDWYSGQIVPDGHRVFDPQPPIYGDLVFQLSQNLVDALYNTRGITQLYSHQAQAINHLYDGSNVIVSTSTSSGKSLIYQIPVLHELEKDHNTRAMYIFPTKALAQDQKKSMKDLLRFMHGLEQIIVETFDGDTPMFERNKIREEARIIFTNPDMLHITILPQEDSWRNFLRNLKFVVVDELHVYNGLFGAHVALIMRRLRRVCAAVGNRHVKFISCSATVANPEEHMKTIFGIEDVKLVDFDGSPSGRKEFLCWNTPYKDPKDPSSGRGDTFAEAAKLFCQLILRGVRVIAFCRIRKTCEILLTAVKNELNSLERPEVMTRVMSYRGGYTPQDRRKIEKEMFEGKLVGIVATNALELGIDIGSLDAVMTVGFPYTIANLRQQSGRAGRRNKDSLSVLVDLQNIMVLEGHIQCAAHEMPIRPEDDLQYFGELLPTIAEERMRKDADGFYHTNERFLPRPSNYVAIRDTEDDHFAIIDTTNGRNVVLEELEASRAFFTIYDGGIFLHQGNTYLIKEFSQERLMAKVERVKVDWTTQQRDFTDIDPVETEAIRQIPGSLSKAFYGPIKIKQVVFGFFKVDKKRRILDAVQVDNPPIILFSKGMWLDVPKAAIEILQSRRLNVAGAIHAAEHAILSLMPNFVISMPGDVRTECKNALKEFQKRETSRKRPARLTFYDAKGGAHGSGISTKAFEFIDLLLRQAAERVSSCYCQDGCLECCCSESCKEKNQVMSKAGSEVILKSLLNWDIDIDALPMGEEERVPAGVETVVPAEPVRPRPGHKIDIVEIKREEGGVKRVVVGVVGHETSNDDKDNDDANISVANCR